MKALSIILGVLLLIVLGIAGLGSLRVGELNTQVDAQKAIISTLNDSNTNLTNDNIKLIATSNLKSFENVKALERFLKGSTVIRNSDPDDYASVSCVALMREARESGYWMGITGINTTDESIYSAMTRRQRGATDISWHIFNIAIVGDSDIYLVDSQEAENYFRLASISGDFADYNKVSGSNVDNLNVH